MSRMPTFSPSLMCMDLLHAAEDVEILNRRADAYHVDLMDGHFAPNITLSPDTVKALSAHGSLPMDVHMMVTRPTRNRNNTNMLALGARVVGVDLARMIARMWLEAEYEGGRHQRRVNQIAATEAGLPIENQVDPGA